MTPPPSPSRLNLPGNLGGGSNPREVRPRISDSARYLPRDDVARRLLAPRVDGPQHGGATRKRFTLELRFRENRDAIANQTGFANTYEAIVGSPLYMGETVASGVNSDDEKALHAWAWTSVSVFKSGVKSVRSKPVIPYKGAASQGFASTKEYIQAIIQPFLVARGIHVRFMNEEPSAYRYNITIRHGLGGQFLLNGDTLELHESLINFKDFGLWFRGGFWQPQKFISSGGSDVSYNPTDIVEKLVSMASVDLTDLRAPPTQM